MIAVATAANLGVTLLALVVLIALIGLLVFTT